MTPSISGYYFSPVKRNYANVTADSPNQDFVAGVLANSGLTLTGLYCAAVAWGDYDNDGDLDFAVSGEANNSNSGVMVTKVMRNDGANFTDTGASLTGVYCGNLAWGDYDNDGDLDLAMSGNTTLASSSGIAKIYRNDAGTFKDINAGLPNVPLSFAWGDYDNDGRLDLAVSGLVSQGVNLARIYHNQGTGFVDSGIALPSIYGTVAWGDYDRDGDVDLLISGWMTSSYVAKVMRNNTGSFTDSGVTLSFDDRGQSEWIDFDCDRNLDLALGQSRYGPRLFHNDGNGSFTAVTNTGIPYGSWTGAAWETSTTTDTPTST